MLWFDGSIENAIDKVKSSGVTLIVFVRGNDRLSQAYDAFLTKKTSLKAHEYIALRISQASRTFRQFIQIYYSVPVPSLFFIKSNGAPLKVVSSENISDILTAISDVFGKEKEVGINSCEEKLEEDEDDRKKGDSYRFPVEGQHQDPKPGQCPSKSSYAKHIGYKLFDVTEDEIKQRLCEIRSFPRFLLIHNSFPDPSALGHPIPKIQSARIQFRLPNNDLPSWEFPDLSTLGDVKAYLMEKVNLAPDFKLLQACPRRGFTPEDEHKTLVELSLAPSATLIVIPVQDKTVQARVKNIVAHQNIATLVLQTLFQPFLIFINYLKKHVLKMPRDNTTIKSSRLPSNSAIGKM